MVEEKNVIEEAKNEEENNGLSRRKFLITTGALATGLLATGGIIGCGSKGGVTAAGGSSSVPVPWKYEKLNVDLVRKRGFEAYHKFG
jgi:hypothetical protein